MLGSIKECFEISCQLMLKLVKENSLAHRQYEEAREDPMIEVFDE